MDMLNQGRFSNPSTQEREGLAFAENFMWMMPQFYFEDQEQFKKVSDGNPDSGLFTFDQMLAGSETPMMPISMDYFHSFFGSDPLGQGKMQIPMMQTLPRPMLYQNTKKIGTLSFEERRTKVYRFLEKRKCRNFSKKVSYNCRKRVADNRIRVKGRFITKSQAEAIMINESSRADS